MKSILLLERINLIHFDCHELIRLVIATTLPVAGNIGIFCQNEEEYDQFTELKNEITLPSDNPNQKYFELKKPFFISVSKNAPSATYTHLYIRKPDPTPYGNYLGDIDFDMDNYEYIRLKKSVARGEILGAEIYNRPGWDTIQLTNPNINSVAYISTKEFTQKIRVKFDLKTISWKMSPTPISSCPVDFV